MGKKLVVTVSTVTMLSLLVGCAPIAGSELTLGVKKGGWIEYHIVITGTPVPEHNVHGLESKSSTSKDSTSRHS